MRAECGVLVVCETEAPIGFAARPPLPSGTWIRLAPGGRLSNPEEELKDGGPRCAGGKMAAASVSAASDSQFSVRGGVRVASRGDLYGSPGCLTFQAALALASALVPQDGGLPEAACHSRRLQLCFLEQQPTSFPSCVHLSTQAVLWSVVRSRAGALSGLLKQSSVGHVSVTAQLGNPQ